MHAICYIDTKQQPERELYGKVAYTLLYARK
jgi:hypothetical protein